MDPILNEQSETLGATEQSESPLFQIEPVNETSQEQTPASDGEGVPAIEPRGENCGQFM
jgi:hypothetical protein